MYKQRLVDARLQAEQDLEAGAINIQYQTRNSMHNVKTTTLRVSDERKRAMGLTTSSATTMRNLERFEQESRAKSSRGGSGSALSSDHKERQKLQQQQQQQQQQRRMDRTVTRDLYDRSLISQVKHGKGPAYEQFKERVESLYIVDRGGDGDEQQQKRKTQKSSSNSNHQPPKLKKWSKMKVEKRLEEKKLEDTVEYWRRMSRPDGIEPTRQSIYDQSVQQRQQQELSW